MRFSIRDLLLWTTIAAIYAAFAGALESQGLLDYGDGISLAPLLRNSVFPILMLMMCLISYVRLGHFLVSFRRNMSYWAHMGLIFVSAVLIGRTFSEERFFYVGFLLSLFLNHVMIEAMFRITLGKNGVIIAITMLSWDNYAFEMEPTTNQLHITALSKVRKKWGHWSTSLAVPTNRVEEVRAVIEAKQGATEAKTG